MVRHGSFLLGSAIPAASVGVAELDAAAEVRYQTYELEDLAAGADVADRAIWSPQQACEILDIRIIGAAAAAGIDASNTSVWLLEKNGSTQIASKTYNDGTPFPAAGAPNSLGALTNATLAIDDEVTLSVTNGATADTPKTLVQIAWRPA